jgi:hypothetical protein
MVYGVEVKKWWTAEQLREKAKELKDEHMRAWEFLHSLVRSANMPGGDAIFFEYPVKTPSLEVYDHIDSVIESVIEHFEKREG